MKLSEMKMKLKRIKVVKEIKGVKRGLEKNRKIKS